MLYDCDILDAHECWVRRSKSAQRIDSMLSLCLGSAEVGAQLVFQSCGVDGAGYQYIPTFSKELRSVHRSTTSEQQANGQILHSRSKAPGDSWKPTALRGWLPPRLQ